MLEVLSVQIANLQLALLIKQEDNEQIRQHTAVNKMLSRYDLAMK